MSGQTNAWTHPVASSALCAEAPRRFRSTRAIWALVALCALLFPSMASAEHRGSRSDRHSHHDHHDRDDRDDRDERRDRRDRDGRHDHDERYERQDRRNRYGSYDRPGLYVGGGLVGGFSTRLESELHEIPGVTDVEVDPSVGLTARAGVRVTPQIAIEAQYEWMDDFETSVAGNEIADTQTQALTGNVKGYLATGRIQPYVMAGAGFLTARSDDPRTNFQRTDTDFAARVGGGIEFYLNESVGLSVDSSYVLTAGDVKDLDYVSAGVGVFFRF
ncbi:MAG: porin family protein [Myxococcota bacterium]